MASENELDPRLVELGIEVNGVLRVYNQEFNIRASGTKFGNENQNEIEVKISNLSKEVRDFILTETSPFNSNRTPKRLILRAGRVSTGLKLVFSGDITRSSISQPPDLVLSLKALTGDFQKGKVVSRNSPPSSRLSSIASSVAKDLGVPLVFEASEKTITNYSYSGGNLGQVKKVGQMGDVNAYLDDQGLVVKNFGRPLTGSVRVLDVDSGLVGQPEYTETGVKVKYLLDGTSVLGGGLQIRSILNPAISGLYCIAKLSFDIASREGPFYWIAEATRA